MSVTVSLPDVERRLGAIAQKLKDRVMPFATARAINATLESIQEAGRQDVLQSLEVRPESRLFMMRLVKITAADRARTNRLRGRVGISGDRANLITRHERGGQKTSFLGRPFVFVPVGDARRSPGGGPKRGFQLSQFHPFTQKKSGKKKSKGLTGRNDTYLIVAKRGKSAGRPLIFQRRGDDRLLYVGKPAVPIQDRVNFVPVGRAVARRDFRRNFRAAFITEIRTMKLRSSGQ